MIFSGIDDIVVSYVTGVVEEVASVEGEEVDSAGVMDVMSAYIPAFNTVPEVALTAWVIDMANAINAEKNKGIYNFFYI